MKIYVLNLIGKRKITAAISASLVLLILLATVIGVVSEDISEQLIADTVDSIPYEKIIILDAGHGGEDSDKFAEMPFLPK